MRLFFYAATFLLTGSYFLFAGEFENDFERIINDLRRYKKNASSETIIRNKPKSKYLVYEEKIYNFYSALNNSINNRVDVKGFESALWYPSRSKDDTKGISIFLAPQKVLDSLKILEKLKDSDATKNKGVVIFVLESGNGPIKLSSGIAAGKKQYFFQNGGPINTSWSIYLDNKRHHLSPLDSVYEMATLSLSQPKDLFAYAQKRSEATRIATDFSQVFSTAAQINSQIAHVNGSYNYSSDASMAMMGMAAFSSLIALGSSGSGVSIEDQIKNLPNYISFFAYQLESGDHVTQVYSFSEQKKVIYSKKVFFRIQPSKPTFIFISNEIPEIPETGAIVNNHVWTYCQTNGSTQVEQITPSRYDVGWANAGRSHGANVESDDELDKIITTSYKVFNGIGGLKQNKLDAIALLNNHLEKNRPKICYHLGNFYLSIGDKTNAIKSYREASTDGDLASINNYGVSLFSDDKTESMRDAVTVLSKNAEIGVPHSCFILGIILNDDTSPYFNREAAIKNYEKAALGGISVAAEILELQIKN